MAKNGNGKKNNGNGKEKEKIKDKQKEYILTFRTRKMIKSTLAFLVAAIVLLSFLDKAGVAGQALVMVLEFLFGDAKITILAIVLSLFGTGLLYVKAHKKVGLAASLLAIISLVIGVSGISANQHLDDKHFGAIGYLAMLLANLFGLLVANIVFAVFVAIAFFIFLQFIWHELPQEAQEEKKPAMVFGGGKDGLPEKVKISGVETPKPEPKPMAPKISLFKKDNGEKPAVLPAVIKSKGKYQLPPIDLLNKNESAPTSGNIKENSLIIKKTLENFGIPVEMAEVNVGPAVTQYAFKPAEGVKLSKITTLSNNIALSLAAHPIRIEAPIPGKPLVGIEVPNKVRAMVTLRNLVADNGFTQNPAHLVLALGKDVSGNPVYTDLAETPHTLVAGATGTGKTIFLNSLILSLLYKNTPETLRMIMVDPKRVEFQNYNEIPHLLCPVIYDAAKTMNALQWLAREMERRFEVFSEIPTRNIKTYNSNKSVIASNSQLPYIVLVIDELADLMAAKGRELEAGIVRLAQMARATGIHLVLATQRPSVEVITGLIKANVPSRITFQVTSQVDSRTILDTSGAEKLLGSGDMLFLSSKSSKITRIQGPYISEKEVKRVSDWIAEKGKEVQEPQTSLIASLKETLEQPSVDEKGGETFFGDDDPLFEDVKRIVLETKKASASFLQRRLRIGYSRAARLIDMLEDKGIVGPADGAKPREVYGTGQMEAQLASNNSDGLDESETTPQVASEDDEGNGGWQKI